MQSPSILSLLKKQSKLDSLKEHFLQAAYVKDAAKGYVVVRNFNLSIDPVILELASKCWAEKFAKTKVDAVIGLPDAGARLVSVLADKLKVKHILPAKRTDVLPGSWEDVVSYSNKSFTTNREGIKSHIGFVKKGMRVLLVDDVVAHGETAVAAINALKEAGAEVVGLAVLFDKVWQKGVERIFEETGVETYSLIRIKGITKEGRIEL